MKNYLIKFRYKINTKMFFLLKKLIFKRKNVFFCKIKIKQKFIFNFKLKKNFFFFNKNYLTFKILILCGGDGSIINEFKNFFNKKIYIKCLNFGNLGYLTNNYLKKNYLINNCLGNVYIYNNNNIISSIIFMNEIILKNKKIKIKIKKKIFVSDSIIISTSYGSTGYLFSEYKLQLNSDYLILILLCSHTNYKFIFFFKKIKILINKSLLIIDFNEKIYFNNVILYFFLKKNNYFLNKNKIIFYDK